MRTLNTAQTNLLQSSNRSVHVRVRVDRSDGTYETDDFSSPVITGSTTGVAALELDTGITVSPWGPAGLAAIGSGSSGYSTTSSETEITTTSGSGKHATVTYTASGALSAVTVVNPGTGYAVGDTITIPGGNNHTITITSVGNALPAGNLYTAASGVATTTTGSGSGLTVNTTASVIAEDLSGTPYGGMITSISIQNPGDGYEVGDKIVVTGKATGASVDYTAVFTVKETGTIYQVQNATKPSTAIYTGNFNTVDRTLSGTVTTTSNTTLTGASTLFTKELSVGSFIELNDAGGLRTYITAIASDTSATMADAAATGESSRTIKIKTGSNIVDLSNYEGHNWIDSVEWGDETDSKGRDAEITLVRQIDNLSLVPLIGKSLLNKHIGKESKPIDVSKKIVIEVCTLPMDQNTPLSSDWNEVFRGYIENIEWGTNTISLQCRDLSAKYQDWLIYRTNKRDSNSNEVLYGNGRSFTDLTGNSWVHDSSTRTITNTGGDFTSSLKVGQEIFIQGYGASASEEGLFRVTVKTVDSNTSFSYNEFIGSSLTVTNVQKLTTGTSNIFAIIQNLMSSQNDGYAFDSTSPSASYSANNVDYYLYTPNGTSASLPTSSFKTNLALTGTVTVPSKFALEPHKIVGAGTKFTTELYVGAQVAISYTGGTFSTVVDQIDSDTVLYVQDQSPLALSLITNATQANPCVISSAAHGMPDGTKVTISAVQGMTQLNDNTYTVAGTATNTFQLSGVDATTGHSAYQSDGIFAQAERTMTLDERAAYIPNKTFDALDKTLMDMCIQFAEELGWNFGFRWNDNVTTPHGNSGGAVDATAKGAFVPMLTCPHRDRVTSNVDFTFTPSTYYDITQATISQSRMRNFVRVHYNEYFIKDGETKTTNRNFIEVSDPSSISKYGRRTVRVGGDEGSLALIDSKIEAERFGRAILKDLRNIDLVQDVDMPFFWPAQVGDYYKFESNGDHYDSDQHLAVHSFRHTISDGEATTSMTCRSKPSGYLNSYGNIVVSDTTAPNAPTLTLTTSAPSGLDFAVQGNYEVVTVPSTSSRKFVTAFDDTALSNVVNEVYAGANVTLSYNGGATSHTSQVSSVSSRSYFLEEESGDGYGLKFLQLEDAVPAITFPGTVTLTPLSKIVTGSGTSFTSSFSVNDRIAIQASQRIVTAKIASITDNEELKLAEPPGYGITGTQSGLAYAEAFEDCSITVQGAGPIFSAPVGVTLKSVVSSVISSDSRGLTTVFYMSTNSSDLLSEAITSSTRSFHEGGFYLGESESHEINVTSLTPGTTYYFRCKTKKNHFGAANNDSVMSIINQNIVPVNVMEVFSKFSNIVEFTPTGNNAVHQDANYSDMVQYNPDPDIGSWIESIRNNSDAGPNFAPPANWKMITGTWDTEFKRELTTVKSGIASIKAPSGGSASAAIETALFPVPASGVMRAISTLMTDDDASRFVIQIIQYRGDKSTSNGATQLVVNGQEDLRNETENTWVEMSKGITLATTTQWCKFKFLRANNTGNVYINDVRLINAVPSFRAAYDTAPTTVADGATYVLLYDDASNAPNFDLGGNYTAGTGIFVAPRDGVYEFEAQLSTSHSDPTNYNDVYYTSNLAILVEGAAVAVTYGDMLLSRHISQFRVATGPLALSKGDEVKVKLENNSGKVMTLLTTTGHGYFTGKQID